jgi:PHP family Zn ribbon phosphoesterase
MKVTYKVNDKLTFELESEGQKQLFEDLGNIQEIFGEAECGKCQSNEIRYRVRDVEENKYYELKCSKCGARFSFGQHKKGGTLFPQKKDKENNWLPDNGWVKWNPQTQQEE